MIQLITEIHRFTQLCFSVQTEVNINFDGNVAMYVARHWQAN